MSTRSAYHQDIASRAQLAVEADRCEAIAYALLCSGAYRQNRSAANRMIWAWLGVAVRKRAEGEIWTTTRDGDATRLILALQRQGGAA